MGCITSKAITRSMSIREELRHGLQSRSAHTHRGGNDHLFAFVCSSNLKTSSFTLPSTTDVPDSSKFMRSKSCHTLREDKDNMPGLKDGKRSLSFHTVEEYDALLERIRAEDSSSPCPWDDHDVELQGSTCLAENKDEDEDDYERCDVDSAPVETGWKRRAVARGLKSLDISPVEVPAIGQKMVEHSPGTYVTPKFGSYNAPTITMPHNDTKQDAVFSPELLAAFEDCMQQLQVEEDTILKHMVDYSFENEVAIANMYKPES